MKNLSKRVTALMLAAITAIPGLFGAPFLSSAETATDLKTFNVEFIRANGESVELTVAQGEALGELPENTPVSHIQATNTHLVYSWADATPQTIVTQDYVFTESEAVEECSFELIEGDFDEAEASSADAALFCVCGNSIAADAAEESASFNKITGVKNLPEEAVDFSELRAAFSKANAFLLSLNDKAAQYDASSIQALIDALCLPEVAAYLGAENTDGFDSDDQSAADALALEINLALEGLTSNVSGVDTSAYIAACDVLNNIDSDAYDPSSSYIGSARRVSNDLLKSTEICYVNPLDTTETSAVYALNDDVKQDKVDLSTTVIINMLYSSVRIYTVTTEGAETDVSFQSGSTTGLSSPYTATYGSKAIARSESEETAWYTEFTSGSTHRPKQFQGVGDTFSTRVFGDLVITAETRTSAAPNMIRIYRNYSNDPEKTPLEAVAFANQSYVLPQAKAYPGYSFAGYDIGGEIKSAGEVIEITGDLDIDALYTFNESAHYAVNATARENGKGFNDTVAYNTTISLEGGDDAYAWVEEVSTGSYRPFAIGSDISFFASESTTLFAVTEEEFAAYNFSLPAINLRKSGAVVSGTKVSIVGQIVDGGKKIKEYGVVVGVAKEGGSISAEDVSITNAGSHEGYDVIRAKSSQLVGGANQFSIGINGLAGKDYIYKGYIIYEKYDRVYVTVYTDAM